MANNVDLQDSETGKALGAVTQADGEIGQAWSSGQAGINGSQGQLGKGPMGQAFVGIYQPLVQQTGQQVQALSGSAQQLVGAGTASIADYLQTSDRLRATFAALPGKI